MGNAAIYAYDPMGRLNMTVAEGSASTQSFAYTNGTNRLASITASTGDRSISYDARGNPTSETRPGAQTVDLDYDGHGRLTSYARSGEASLVHSYNGMDDRVATTTVTGSTSDTRAFVYAPDGRVIGEYGTSAADVKAEFIWMSPEVGDAGMFGGDPGSGSGAGDGLGGYMPLAVAANDNNGFSQLAWVHGNHMGVPAVFTDASGTALTFPTGYAAPGFPGQSRTFADLYYNRYRDYDTNTGRYIQADPIGLDGGASPYSYAMNNPLRYTDPTGLYTWPSNSAPAGPYPGKYSRPAPSWPKNPLVTPPLLAKPDCPPKRPPPPPDWCGSSQSGTQWVPDRPLGYNISKSCKAHDNCYSSNSGVSRRQCDAMFGLTSFLQCMNEGGGARTCAFVGSVYFWGVRLGGSQSYQGGGSRE